MVIKAIIFDLDGVLVFTDKYHYQAWKMLADKENIYFDEKINNRLRGVSRMESLAIILEKASRIYSSNEKVDLATWKNDQYRQLLKNMSPQDVAPSVMAALKKMRLQGIRLAIGSSSKNAKEILNRTGIRDLFDVVSDGTNIHNSKPDPEVFIKAAEMLNLDPQECIVVEDALAGITAAKAGGFIAAGIGDAYTDPRADIRITKIEDLLTYILIK